MSAELMWRPVHGSTLAPDSGERESNDYPPDKRQGAIRLVMGQMESMAPRLVAVGHDGARQA